MSLIKLWIKGPKDIALRAAKERGIDIYNVMETKGRNTIIIADAMDYWHEAILKWHGEKVLCHHDNGHPFGVLLAFHD